jgi:hypothetical protein
MRLLKVLSKQITKERVLVTCQERNLSSIPRENLVYLQNDKIFLIALIAKELTMRRNNAGLRVKPFSSVRSVIIWAIVRNIAK